MLQLTAFGGGFVSLKVTVKSHSTEMLQREQIMRGKEHWPPKCVVRSPFSLFTCLATAQRLVTSPRDPGVVRLHVNAGHFSTTARWATSPTWGPPPPCKQALSKVQVSTLSPFTLKVGSKCTYIILTSSSVKPSNDPEKNYCAEKPGEGNPYINRTGVARHSSQGFQKSRFKFGTPGPSGVPPQKNPSERF